MAESAALTEVEVGVASSARAGAESEKIPPRSAREKSRQEDRETHLIWGEPFRGSKLGRVRSKRVIVVENLETRDERPRAMTESFAWAKPIWVRGVRRP